MGLNTSRQLDAPNRILILGNDASGKTTLLYQAKLGDIVTTNPTIGFNVETIDVGGGNSVTAWDVGGGDRIGNMFFHYTENTDGVLLVLRPDYNPMGALWEMYRVLQACEKDIPVCVVFPVPPDQNVLRFGPRHGLLWTHLVPMASKEAQPPGGTAAWSPPRRWAETTPAGQVLNRWRDRPLEYAKPGQHLTWGSDEDRKYVTRWVLARSVGLSTLGRQRATAMGSVFATPNLGRRILKLAQVPGREYVDVNLADRVTAGALGPGLPRHYELGGDEYAGGDGADVDGAISDLLKTRVEHTTHGITVSLDPAKSPPLSSWHTGPYCVLPIRNLSSSVCEYWSRVAGTRRWAQRHAFSSPAERASAQAEALKPFRWLAEQIAARRRRRNSRMY